ncbi:MAG: mechanosensitive ion channel family protein [Pseudomonadales bacterium]
MMLEQLNNIHPALPAVAVFLALLIGALLADWIAKRLLLRFVHGFAKRSSYTWDDALASQDVFRRVAKVVPALIIYLGIHFVPDLSEPVAQLIRNVAMGYMVLMLTLALVALLNAANQIYESYPVSRERPLKGFVQVVQIVLYVIGGVLIVSVLINRSPLLLLSGFGAMTAILLLVFKDTILSLVASVQITSQDMVRVGDWIEMPQFGADGDVIDVALHTIKVQNFDKTITTIPTHTLISGSFKNWRGMSQSGGRRIKRCVFIDISSVRILTAEELARFKHFALLADYIKQKQVELEDYNAGLKHEVEEEVNLRRLTNIGTFRAYVFNYLKNHPQMHRHMTLLVRQLQPGPEGLPIEIYAFTSTTEWAVYENIQSDIFDHILSTVPEFGLRVFQNPTGSDLLRLTAFND